MFSDETISDRPTISEKCTKIEVIRDYSTINLPINRAGSYRMEDLAADYDESTEIIIRTKEIIWLWLCPVG